MKSNKSEKWVEGQINIIDVGPAYSPLTNITPKMSWEARLSHIGGCRLPRGYGRTKPFKLDIFKSKMSQRN